MSTFLSYPGGKARLSKTIAANLDVHKIYVEPFSGTASVLFAKRRVDFELVNDIDRRLVTLLRIVRDRGHDLAELLALTPYARSDFRADDPDEPGLEDIEIARRTAVRIGQSFAKAGLAQPSKGWRISVRGGRSCAATWGDLPEHVLLACERLRGVHIDCLPALDLIARYGVETDAALYVDPPYLGTARTSQEIYAHEMSGEDAHRELAEALNECRAHVLLSGYHSPLYDDLFESWDRLEIVTTANHNGNEGPVTRRVEVLWSNRPLAREGALFDLEGQAA